MLGIPPEGREPRRVLLSLADLVVSLETAKPELSDTSVNFLTVHSQDAVICLYHLNDLHNDPAFLRKGFIFFGRHNLVVTCTNLMQQWHGCFALLVHVISDFFQPYVDSLANKLMRGLDIISCSSVSVMTILICCCTSDNTTAIPHVCYHLHFSLLFLQAW